MKRYIALLFMILTCFAVFPGTAHADAANDLTRDISAVCEKISGNQSSLFDGDISTYVTLTGDSVISLKCDTPIDSLYLIWDKPPNMWDLTSGGLSATFGRHGFIHEYVKLDEAVRELTLSFHGSENILCNIYAFAGGDAPEWVEQWQPPYEDADMLLLPAHAGDEASYLSTGAIPLYIAALDMKIQLAYITNQWITPKLTHDIISGLYTAGIRAYPVISDFPDTLATSFDEVADIYDENAFIAFYVEQIRRFKPQVIVAPIDSGDGIGQLCYDSLLIAAELSGDELEYRESALEYGVFDISKLYMQSELVKSTVGPDTLSGNFFENIEPDTASESTAQPQESAAEAPPASADAPPAAAPTPPKSAGIPLSNPDSLMIMGGISVLCLIMAALLHIKKEF